MPVIVFPSIQDILLEKTQWLQYDGMMGRWLSSDQMTSQSPFQAKLFCKSMSAYLLTLLMSGIAQTHQINGYK